MSTWSFVTDPAPMHAAFAIRMAAVLAAAVGTWHFMRRIDDFDPGARAPGETYSDSVPRIGMTVWFWVFLLLAVGSGLLRLRMGGTLMDAVMLPREAYYAAGAILLLGLPAMWVRGPEQKRADGGVSRQTAMIATLVVAIPLTWIAHTFSYRRSVGFEVRAGELHVHYAGLRPTARAKPSGIKDIRGQTASSTSVDLVAPLVELNSGERLHGPMMPRWEYDAELRKLRDALAEAGG